MPCCLTRPTLALLSALVLLCLAACAPTATASVAPTATRPPTATPTIAPAPTPTNVPAQWKVLDTAHFSIAYPPDWTPQTIPQQDGSILYLVTAPGDKQVVRVSVQERVPSPTVGAPYCMPASGDIQHTTLAGLPMTYMLSGEGLLLRSWTFANAQRTVFMLDADDAQASVATQAQDEAILATFRPDNATPWSC